MNRNDYDRIIKLMVADRRIRMAIIKKIHWLFFYCYFPSYAKLEMAPFQEEMFRIGQDLSVRNAVIVGFRGCAKSTIFTLSLPLWAIIGEQQLKHIVILSRTEKKAQMILQQIKRELETNDMLKADLGPFQEERSEWNASSLHLTHYKAKITVASTEQSIRSLRHGECRPQLILLDDPDDLESVKTLESRDKTFEWFVGDVIPAGDKNTRTIVTGSNLHEDCLIKRLQKMMADGKMDGICREYPIIDKNGNPTWLAKYPNREAIENERKKGIPESTFQREYMLKIVRGDDQIIRPEWIKDYDIMPKLTGSDCRGTLVAIDPAGSTAENADCTAMVTASVFGTGKNLQIFIHPNPVNKRLAFNETRDLAILLSHSTSGGMPSTLIVEDVAVQKWLIQELRLNGLPVEEFKVGGVKKEERLAVAAGLLQAGMVFFPRSGCDHLRLQLINFGMEKHDDLADAFSMLMIKIMEKFLHSQIFFCRTDDSEFDSADPYAPKPAPKSPENGPLTPAPISEFFKKLWKNEAEKKALSRQADLDCMRRSEFERRE